MQKAACTVGILHCQCPPRGWVIQSMNAAKVRSLVGDKGKSKELVLPEPLLCGEPGARLQLASSL